VEVEVLIEGEGMNEDQNRWSYIYIPTTVEEYSNMNSLRDYFKHLERARMRSTTGKRKSIYDHWYKTELHENWFNILLGKGKIFSGIKDIEGEYRDLNTRVLRETLYFMGGEPTGF